MTRISSLYILYLITFITYVTSWCQINKFLDFGPVLALDYSPDNTMILTVTGSKLTIWQKATKRIIFSRAVTNAYYAKFSKNSPSSYIGISSNSSIIQIISGVSPFGTIQSFNAGHGGPEAVGMDFTSNTVLITCGGQTNKVKLWDITTNPASNTFMSTIAQMSICGFSTPTTMGSATTNNKLYYNAISGGITNIFTVNANSCKQIVFSPDGTQMLAACSSASGISGYFITVATPTISGIITTGDMFTTAYAGDSKTCCYGGNTNILYIVNATSANKTILSQFITNSHILTSDFTNDGSYLLVGTQDGTVYQYAKYCLDCMPGYYSNMTTKSCVLCQTTLKGCSNCVNSSNCIQCYQNFIYDATNFKCLGCSGLIDGCGTCLNFTACRYCMIGYYMLANNTCVKCQSALTGCYACNSSAYCFECQSDFYLASNNTCIGCQINNPLCIKCVNTSYCTTCKVGYYENSGVCQVCPINCYICQSSTNCTDCRTGYYPLSSGGTVICTKCPSTGCLACNSTGYCFNCDDQRYLDAGSCTLCPYPCLTCNASNYCFSCESAYFSDGVGGCIQCSSGCSSCNSSSICLSCSSGYYLELLNSTCMDCQSKIPNCMQCTNVTCKFCQLGFYLSNPTTCSRCINQMVACAGCSSSTICDFCSSGYYKGSGTGNQSCQICVLGCATCISSTNCTSCNIGYYLDVTSATCNLCINNCVTCSNTTYCLQCEIGYSLGSGGTCISCSLGLSNCLSCVYNYTASSLWCLSCKKNAYVDSTTGICVNCSGNCTTCYNAGSCQSCQIGSYLDSSYLCKPCHSNCSECIGSSTNCSSCIAGYYLTSTYKCQHCSIFGCQTCNSTTHDCISCQIGFYIKTVTGTPSKICDNCLSMISNCYICISQTICKQCSYGYALATDQLSCYPCSVVEGCKHCVSLSSCQNCELGYYLFINGSGFGLCNKCSVGCKQCDSTGVCLVCFSEYSKQTISGIVTCLFCNLNMTGCLICSNSSQCINCLPGYYLDLTVSCKLCTVSLFACQFCNSSSICTKCQDGYYVNSSNLCQRCETALTGCNICNSSSVCLACQFGMYLNSNLCYKCSVNLPNCLYCQNLTTCLQCDAGSYLDSVLSICVDCDAHIPGCIQCSSASYCLQCRGGYYLDSTTNLCSACNQVGCQVCVQTSPLSCIKCNSRFYMNSTLGTCVKCRSQIDGCLQCSSSTTCSQCDPGYFTNSTFECQLCQSVMNGCGRCLTSSICLQCKSTYYLNSSFKCQECKLIIPGCSFCINSTACQSCYHGYYLTTSYTCQTCTSLPGCLSCINQTYCQFCQRSYFLQATENICYPCSALLGCYACTTNLTCSICIGGYILNDDQLCELMRVQAKHIVKDLKLVTKYVNSSCLIHYLYAKGMAYTKSDYIDWNRTTKLILENEKYQQINLIILKVQWGNNNYTLIFYTDNPLDIGKTQFPMARRLLSTQLITPRYKVNLKMNQTTINKILPQLYLPNDLVMDYDLNSPEFIMSYLSLNSKLLFYSVFGYIITSILIIQYIIKASCSAPASPEMGDIIPQVLALKAPAFFVYPGFMQWVYYCIGFTFPDFPWLNQAFGNILADTSNIIPLPFSLFFSNLHIGSTYLLAVIAILLVIFVLTLLYKNKQKEYEQGFPIGNVFFYIFIFGATWASCVSLQGGILNPIQGIDVNSGFYMIGIAFYCLIFGICIYRIYVDRRNLSKMRIFIKASLLSFANISPIYIFFSAVLIDLTLVIIEHNFIKNKRIYPRLWILKNIFCNLALCVLSIWTTALASLIITSFLVIVALFLDVFTHFKEFKEANNRKKLKLENNTGNQSEIDVNVWNINFQKEGGSKLQQLQKQQEFEKQGRKTGFDGTRATNFISSKRKTILQTRKKIRKAKNEVRPDIINITENKKIKKDEPQDLSNNMQFFIAKTNME